MPDASCEDDRNALEKVLAVTSPENRGLQKDCSRSDSSSQSEVVVCSLATELENLLETDPFFAIPKFQSLLYSTILEKVITSCRILNACNNHLRVSRVYDDMPLLLNNKYSIAKPAIMPGELDAIDPKRLGCDEYKLYKLEKDRDDTMRAMQETYKGMALSNGFRPLWNFCRDATELLQYREALKTDTAKNKVLARTLHRQLRQLRVQHTTAEDESDGVEDDLRKQIQDAEQMAAVKERYTTNWQMARTEQFSEDISLKQGVYSNSIEYHKRRSEQESIVHGEIEMLVNIAIQEKLQRIEEIMTKYDTDMEVMDLKIQIGMSDLNRIVKQRDELTELLRTRTKEIKEWVKFKDDRAEAQKFHNDMTRAACIVQAWWRGLLVRKQLGPFRPSKKPKPAKKKK